MANDNDVFKSGDRVAIRRAVAGQFLLGGGVGIGAFIGVLGFVIGLWLLSSVLPEESKQAADPTPDSFPHLVADDDG